jgi:hypothetical protein
MALAKDATHAGLRDLYNRVKAAGLLGAAVADAGGEPMPLSQLIISRGKEAEAAEAFAGGAPADDEPAQGTLAAVKAPKDAA